MSVLEFYFNKHVSNTNNIQYFEVTFIKCGMVRTKL